MERENDSLSKKRKRKKLSVKGKIIIAELLLIIAGVLYLVNRWEVVIDTPQTITVEYGHDFQIPEPDAYVKGTLLPFIHMECDVETNGEVDTNTIGEYTVSYTATYKDLSDTKQTVVKVEDHCAPVITLISSVDSYTPFNHPYEEEGYFAFDRKDGNVKDRVIVEEKDGIVTYTVSDEAGNTNQAQRELVYDDRVGPVITLDGGESVTVFNGSPYEDHFTAVDDCDGDVTDRVSVEGSVDTSVNGTYTLTYRVNDEHGNQTVVERIVTVKNKPVDEIASLNDPHVIYLTFDDGPGPYTMQLLDILDQYQVKATFFTTSGYAGYTYCIGEEAKRGHVVAVHTYTHNYASIYSSTEAYWNDFNLQNQVVQQQTGQSTNLFRFPGGSSNTVSANYSSGIMSVLAQESANKGYYYYDWNVSSGDAGGATTSDQVYNNVVAGIQANTAYGHASIVLQHDIKDFSVNAVERIIVWALDNGYVFKTLSPESPKSHHGINN